MPNDGGSFIISDNEFRSLPISRKILFKKYVGSSEFINSNIRYCLWLYNIKENNYADDIYVNHIINKVRSYRLESKRKATQN